jgi:putative MATE family efflux protein
MLISNHYSNPALKKIGIYFSPHPKQITMMMMMMMPSCNYNSCWTMSSVLLLLLLFFFASTPTNHLVWGFQHLHHQHHWTTITTTARPPFVVSTSFGRSRTTTSIIGRRKSLVLHQQRHYGEKGLRSCPSSSVLVRQNFLSTSTRSSTTTALRGVNSSLDEEEENEEEDETIAAATTGFFTKDDRRRLNREFRTIAIPALLQLTAEPLAGLVDTAYLGRIGSSGISGIGGAASSVLGGVGVAISAHYAVSKLYNDPLLRTSISLVARASANDGKHAQSRAVSSALFLAGFIGIAQMILYVIFGRRILTSLGVGVTSTMYPSAIGYLTVRAYGTPAATLWLVSNGIFRGLGDTKTPLYYSFLFTILNAILDPLFIFTFGWGAAGAAAGTTIAQYVALLPLLWALHKKVPIRLSSSWEDLTESLQQYVNAGLKVFIRTMAKVWCYSICARQAAILGPVSAAAYNLTFQLGFAVTQICESIAIAVQTLLAREMGSYGSGSGRRPNRPDEETTTTSTTTSPRTANVVAARLRHLISTSVTYGGVVAIGLSLLTYWRRDILLRGLTTNVEIQTAAAHIFPVVLFTQVAKGFCYPVNGILMGGLDWTYTMIVMWLANAVCCAVLMLPTLSSSTHHIVSLERIWWGLCAFMTTQVVLGVARYQSHTGPWRILRSSSSSGTNTNMVVEQKSD